MKVYVVKQIIRYRNQRFIYTYMFLSKENAEKKSESLKLQHTFMDDYNVQIQEVEVIE